MTTLTKVTLTIKIKNVLLSVTIQTFVRSAVILRDIRLIVEAPVLKLQIYFQLFIKTVFFRNTLFQRDAPVPGAENYKNFFFGFRVFFLFQYLKTRLEAYP
jgi:hypothetical protein